MMRKYDYLPIRPNGIRKILKRGSHGLRRNLNCSHRRIVIVFLRMEKN
ncbi:hypothetical protein Bhyg_05022 [Pseudolycoriella hygida]|uniref:Uncharacterized protein n=1 Tax=Pseudolycoriella hygida TaxID=35572 RepID=A0A9Q0NH11_9DIPT|nr:hypothetical protein Bhyg_05022 [Pseudolycoriella hygida]